MKCQEPCNESIVKCYGLFPLGHPSRRHSRGIRRIQSSSAMVRPPQLSHCALASTYKSVAAILWLALGRFFTAFPGKRASRLKSKIPKDELVRISALGSDHDSRATLTLFVV